MGRPADVAEGGGCGGDADVSAGGECSIRPLAPSSGLRMPVPMHMVMPRLSSCATTLLLLLLLLVRPKPRALLY